MGRWGSALVALCLVLLGSIGGAQAQTEDDKRYDLKPLIPPVFPLPPNYQVSPGTPARTPSPTDSTPQYNTPPPQTPAAPGLRITIPK